MVGVNLVAQCHRAPPTGPETGSTGSEVLRQIVAIWRGTEARGPRILTEPVEEVGEVISDLWRRSRDLRENPLPVEVPPHPYRVNRARISSDV